MKSLILPFLLALSLICEAAPLPEVNPGSEGFDAERLSVMHASLDRFITDGQQAGIITLLLRNGRVVDFHAAGCRDIGKGLPMERDTICRVYSMSKIVSAVALLILFEEGRFNLDDPVSEYLPELKDLKVMTGGTAESPILIPLSRPVTIHHLLTHTSGFGYDFDGVDAFHQIYQRADLWSDPGMDAFLKKVASLPLRHQPGEAFTYGINFDVIGALIERISGQRFPDFLEKRIFIPLEMKDTGFCVPAEKAARLARTYKHGADGKLVEADPMIGVRPELGKSLASGGGGLFSTADDFARLAQMLLNKGTLENHRILGRKTVDLMTVNHLSALSGQIGTVGPGKGFGYGVEVTTDTGLGDLPVTEGQFGWYGAATTYCQVDPREHLVAIALAQHFPFNEHKFFQRFETGYYQALK